MSTPNPYPTEGAAQPSAPQAPQPGHSQQPAAPRYRGLSITGFVLSLIGPLTVAGLVVSIIALVKSSKANEPKGFALAGTIIGAVGTLLVILFTVAAVFGVNALLEQCQGLGPGVHYVDGVEYTCS